VNLISRNRLRSLRLVAATALLAGSAVVLTPGTALASPGGGLTVTATCLPSGYPGPFKITEHWSGLLPQGPNGYWVTFSYQNSEQQTIIAFRDTNSPWTTQPDGSADYVFNVNANYPTAQDVSWSLDQFSGTETDGVLTGGATLYNGYCKPKATKPRDPEVTDGTLIVDKKGHLEVPLEVDPKVTGSVDLIKSGNTIATGTYNSHSKDTVSVGLDLSKKALKHLKKIKYEPVKTKITSRNVVGQSKTATTASLNYLRHR
jgi:hypothetical protein